MPATQFLVTTTHALLLLDTENQTVSTIHSGNGLYFGLTYSDGHYYVGCRNELRGPVDDVARSKERGSILVLNEKLEPVDEIRPDGFPLRDIHGVAVFDGKLWVTCSFDNAVAVFDLTSRETEMWYPDPEVRGRDVNHFNGIGAVEQLVYVVAHHWGPSQIHFYDRGSRDLRHSVDLGVCAHDFFEIDGELATCSSGAGEIVTESGRRFPTGGFPRGIAVTDNSVLVGISETVPRAERAEARGVIRIFDLFWREQLLVDLPGSGMILDIFSTDQRVSLPATVPEWPETRWLRSSPDPSSELLTEPIRCSKPPLGIGIPVPSCFVSGE